MYRIPLSESLFGKEPQVVLQSDEFTVTAFAYPQSIAALKIANSRGFVEVLPLMGQIIWDAVFDGKSLRMDNMFRKPQRGSEIVDTYGCFAFHSGLLTGGCPSPEDTHPLHGEFPCAPMDKAWLEVDENSVRVVSEYEYVRGFGHHYLASPSVTLTAGSPRFDIGMRVENLSGYQLMPLLYMCHMNYAYAEQGQMRQNLPDARQRVPTAPHRAAARASDAAVAGVQPGHPERGSGRQRFGPPRLLRPRNRIFRRQSGAIRRPFGIRDLPSGNADYVQHALFQPRIPACHPLDSEQSRPKSRRVRAARHRPPRRLSGGGKSRHAAMAATGRGQIVYRQHGNQGLEPGSSPGYDGISVSR